MESLKDRSSKQDNNSSCREPITFYGLSCVLVPTGPIYVFVMMMRYKVLKFLSTDSHKVEK